MKFNRLNVPNENGNVFTAKLIKSGDQYGLNNKLVNESDDFLIEFYTSSGQFASRYFLETFLSVYHKGEGILLEGSIPEWTLDSRAVEFVALNTHLLTGE